MTDEQLLVGLKKADNSALKEVYLSYKDAFIAFALGFNLGEDDALDIYQDAVLALRENVLTGKLNKLNSSLKTYVFSIGKYMIYDKLRAEKKWISIKNSSQLEDISLPDSFEVLFNNPLNEREMQLKEAFKKLGKKCQQLLQLFYFQGYNLDEIKVEMNYSNKDVLKSQKSRCLKTLKENMTNGR